jgi:gamma-glutamylcyclotransferase (GGCT)/AIG2-like uncharacterized protein YtfP
MPIWVSPLKRPFLAGFFAKKAMTFAACWEIFISLGNFCRLWAKRAGSQSAYLLYARPMPSPPFLLFVYGTLRRGSAEPLALRLMEEAVWLGHAETRGFLYRIDGYPGFIPDAGGGAVTGDLFNIGGPGALLAALDEYEQCSPALPEPHEYRRAVVRVQTGEGMMDAWTYIYAWPVDPLSLIASGDFLA